MARKKGITFHTTQEKKTRQLRLFVLGFVSFILVFALVSALYMFKSQHLSLKDLFPEKTTENVSESTLETSVPLEGSAGFMLAVVSDNKDDVFLAAAVYADLDSGEVRVCAIDPKEKTSVNGISDSLKGHYARSGANGLKKGVEALCGFESDKYAISTESQFKNAINVLSGAQITVPERIKYKTEDLNLSLMPGEQNIKGETLLKYFRYMLTSQGGGANKQSELLCELFSQYITKTYLASGRNYFSQIIDGLETDISIMDFSRSESKLSAMATGDIAYSAVSLNGLLKQSEAKR